MKLGQYQKSLWAVRSARPFEPNNGQRVSSVRWPPFIPRHLGDMRRRWVSLLVVVSSLVVLGLIAAGHNKLVRADGDGQGPYPLISRGFTAAREGTVVLGADPGGGNVVVELRVEEGQHVKKGDIIAVLSNFPSADFGVKRSELELEKQGRVRQSLISGPRADQVHLQELTVESAHDMHELKTLELARSSKPGDIKELELKLSADALAREQLRLKAMKEALSTDLEQIEIAIRIQKEAIKNQINNRNLAQVRAPFDGLVVSIYTRSGEAISPRGIAQIVDFSKLSIEAELDEIHLSRVKVGSPVDISFRGSSLRTTGKVVRIVPAVRRLRLADPAQAAAIDSRIVGIQISFDRPDDVPKLLGREVRIIYK